MLLPQSSAFAALKNRLNSVSSIGYLHIAPRPCVPLPFSSGAQISRQPLAVANETNSTLPATQQLPISPPLTAPTASKAGKKASSGGASSSKSSAPCRNGPAGCSAWAAAVTAATSTTFSPTSSVWLTAREIKRGTGTTAAREGAPGQGGDRCRLSGSRRRPHCRSLRRRSPG